MGNKRHGWKEIKRDTARCVCHTSSHEGTDDRQTCMYNYIHNPTSTILSFKSVVRGTQRFRLILIVSLASSDQPRREQFYNHVSGTLSMSEDRS